MDLDAYDVADELPPGQLGICHTMKPGQVHVALRTKDTVRDFDDDLDAMLADGP
jgi:hypothetical protein